jgi:hypothetical protein
MARPLQKTDERGKYRQEFATQAAKLCALGATNDQLADFFEVGTRTIEVWIAEKQHFGDAVRDAKKIADEKVVRSLYERATGYKHPDTVVTNNRGEIILTDVTKHYPPDTTAAIFWLKNRDQKNWRDRTELTGADNTPLIPQTEPIELARRVAFMLHSAALQKES